jgi:hypothetical protein
VTWPFWISGIYRIDNLAVTIVNVFVEVYGFYYFLFCKKVEHIFVLVGTIMHLVHLSFKVFIIRISPETIENLTKTTCSSFYLRIYSNIFYNTFFFSTIKKLYLMNVRKALKVR